MTNIKRALASWAVSVTGLAFFAASVVLHWNEPFSWSYTTLYVAMLMAMFESDIAKIGRG
jgi:hypothetical protein